MHIFYAALKNHLIRFSEHTDPQLILEWQKKKNRKKERKKESKVKNFQCAILPLKAINPCLSMIYKECKECKIRKSLKSTAALHFLKMKLSWRSIPQNPAGTEHGILGGAGLSSHPPRGEEWEQEGWITKREGMWRRKKSLHYYKIVFCSAVVMKTKCSTVLWKVQWNVSERLIY